jgi:hypothetical protein
VIGLDQVSPHEEDACQQPACWGVEPEVFFGPTDSPAGRSLYIWEQRALAVCEGCPIVAECLAEALEYPVADQYGVVGGMTAGQRQAAMTLQRHGRGRARRSPDRRDVLVQLGDEVRDARSARPAGRSGGRQGPSKFSVRTARAG